MLFTTPLFLFFFLPFFLLAYYLAPAQGQLRNFIALFGSLIFFSWGEPVYVFFLLVLVFLDYQLSKAISQSSNLAPNLKKSLLFLGILINIGFLISFKYSNFIIKEILLPLNLYTGQAPAGVEPLLLGISFITFHKISYLVDSYKGRATPPRNFYDCALYIFLFPQLIAGPIIRYHDIGSQIHQRTYSSTMFLLGCFRFCLGFAKKILIADQLGLVADRIFALPVNEVPLGCAWAGAFSYMLQIYFDFSGYSDMAIGLGCMLGFRFPENFNRPYISKSVTEFWRRWHISLSSWMRLYLYIPLGGNRGSKSRAFINLWIVFLISGFWHGANWTFLAWGAYYGFFLSIEKYCTERLPALQNYLPSQLKLALTLLIVLFGWVLFRSPNLGYALDFIKIMLGASSINANLAPWGFLINNRDLFFLLFGAAIVFVKLPNKPFLAPKWITSVWSESMSLDGNTLQLSLLFVSTVVLLILSTMAMYSAGYSSFLYFRF